MRFRKPIFALLAAVFAVYAAPEAKAQPGVTTLNCTPPAADPEIAGLARALNYNFVQIYEYVYNTIEFSPTYGSKKGALGTYLDRRGNNFDQNVLFVTLLRQSCHTANYRHGSIDFSSSLMANLLGVQNDAAVVSSVLANGKIPHCFVTSPGAACDSGATAFVRATVLWTEATDSASQTTYRLDPSLKSHTLYSPIDMASVTGYSRSTFLNAALIGSSSLNISGANSIKNLNRANITSSLNTHSEALANHIKASHPSSSAEVVPVV
jgi:hypothetical protein